MKRTPQIPSLADIGQRRSADEIATVIREGRGRMPGFPALPPPALAALVTFLRTGESDRAGHDTSAIALKYRFTGRWSSVRRGPGGRRPHASKRAG